MVMMIHEVLDLLGVENINGNPQQLAQLCSWIDDLARTNGKDWVRKNRELLIQQWDSSINRKPAR